MIAPFVLVLALALSASHPPSPNTPDVAKGNSSEAVASVDKFNEPADNALPPITVVVQPPAEDEAAKARAEQREERSVRASEQMITLTVILITAAVVTLFFLGWQSWETRRAANAAISQVAAATTARLYIEGVTATNFEAGKEPVFLLRIANTGLAPAESVYVFIEIDHMNGGTRPAQPNAVIIPANGFREYDFRASFLLPSDLNELEQWNLHVKGTVKHLDRVLPFCFKYNHWAGTRPSGVRLFVPCDYDQRRHVTAAISGVGAMGFAGTIPSLRVSPTKASEPDGEQKN